MRKTSIFVVAALLYGAMGSGPVKRGLEQLSANSLVQVDTQVDSEFLDLCACECQLPSLTPPDLEFCTCDIDQGTLPPIVGGGEFNTF